MSNVNLLVNFSLKHSNKIQKLCDPLYQHFGVTDFWYAKTTAKGLHSTFESNIQFLEYYFCSKLYLSSPIFMNPKMLTPRYFFYHNVNNPEFQHSLSDASEKVHSIPCFSFVQKEGGDVIRFGYGVHPDQMCKRDFFLNNLSLLEKFNSYIFSEAQDLIKGAEEYSIDLQEEFGAKFNSQSFPSSMNCENRCKFLDAIKQMKFEDVRKLTSREIECLKHLSKGLTSIQISIEMSLSLRTVECHLFNIKNKLNCYQKSELFRYSSLLHQCGYFD